MNDLHLGTAGAALATLSPRANGTGTGTGERGDAKISATLFGDHLSAGRHLTPGGGRRIVPIATFYDSLKGLQTMNVPPPRLQVGIESTPLPSNVTQSNAVNAASSPQFRMPLLPPQSFLPSSSRLLQPLPEAGSNLDAQLPISGYIATSPAMLPSHSFEGSSETGIAAAARMRKAMYARHRSLPGGSLTSDIGYGSSFKDLEYASPGASGGAPSPTNPSFAGHRTHPYAGTEKERERDRESGLAGNYSARRRSITDSATRTATPGIATAAGASEGEGGRKRSGSSSATRRRWTATQIPPANTASEYRCSLT